MAEINAVRTCPRADPTPEVSSETVTHWLHQLAASETSVREKTLLEIWRYGAAISEPRLHRVVAALALSDAQESIRWRALEALICMSADPQKVVGVFKAALTDHNFYVRLHALRALRLYVHPSDLRSILSMLLPHPQADIREEIVQELGSFDLDEPTAASFANIVRYDPSPAVRLQAALILADSRLHNDDVQMALCQALEDADGTVRAEAALALTRRGHMSPVVISILSHALEDKYLHLEAWQALTMIAMTGDEHGLEQILKETSSDRLLSELVSQGVLPTIGLKVWNKPHHVEIPAKKLPGETKYPWHDQGVYHSWFSHCADLGGTRLTEHQVCLNSDWFPDVHLVALAQLVLFEPPKHDSRYAPCTIEGRGSGYIIQSGGTLRRLTGMRRFSCRMTNRLDFVAGYRKDMKVVQYLVYGGLAEHLIFPAERRPIDQAAAEVWRSFTVGFTAQLEAAGLSSVAHEQWFTEIGWRSPRYERRFERPYNELQPGLAQLSSVLQTSHGPKLRHELGSLLDPLLTQLELAFYAERQRQLQHVARFFEWRVVPSLIR